MLKKGQYEIDAAHRAFAESVEKMEGIEVYRELLYRFAYGTDASLYRYVPQLVLRVHRESLFPKLMELATKHSVALTFRASGTSLSGQATSASVLVLLGDDFYQWEILEEGEKIRLGAMVIGGEANRYLAPYQRKIGPDPASINTARVGGIVANNSSGMCCGTRDNSYHTIESIKLILADGSYLDSGDEESVAAFRLSHAQFLAELGALRAKILADEVLHERIATKYRLKNTTGYGVNALIDFEDPLDILIHLIVGSEGTLAFISEVTYRTVPEYPHKASAFIYFDSLEECCRAVQALRGEAPVEAVELLDGKTTHFVGEVIEDLPPFFYLPLNHHAGTLLIETMAESDEALDKNIGVIEGVLSRFKVDGTTHFQQDPKITTHYWNVRKGLLPITAKARQAGANIITEDVVFPMEHLVEGVLKLTELFEQYDYPEAMIMGHALEGNLHFLLAPLMEDDQERDKFNRFLEALVELVAVELGGSLKGEHGTGRNIAPFVEREWGSEIYQIMWQIKELFDPDGILNPDVLMTNNGNLHLEGIKPLPVTDELINACMECGFCEPACPSNGLSLTPRQRISLYRNIEALQKEGADRALIDELLEGFNYAVIETCAETGMCSLRCPVGINTGQFVHQLRPLNRSKRVAKAGGNFLKSEKSLRRGVGLAHTLKKPLHYTSKWGHKLFKGIPVIPKSLPALAPSLEKRRETIAQRRVVYFLSCVNRTLAEVGERRGVADYTLTLFERAGIEAIMPKEMGGYCCGQPFISLKEERGAQKQAEALNQLLVELSEGGVIPIYLDNSPCALRAVELQREGLLDERLQLYHPVEYLLSEVVPHLTLKPHYERLYLHTPCTTSRKGLQKSLETIVAQCAKEVIPSAVDCCGFAGSKGITLPELNQNSLRHFAPTVKERGEKQNPSVCGVSVSKMCQVGLTEASELPFYSLEVILAHASA